MEIHGLGAQAWVSIALLLTGSGTVLAACGSSSPEGSPSSGSAYPNSDISNSRHTEGPIDSSSVSELELAWTLPLRATTSYGSISSSPVVSGGVAYIQDLESNVQAIDLDDGEILWTREYGLPSQGPNGVVVADGLVYGATPTTAFALEQETGRQVWSVELVRSEGEEGIAMAPGYDAGRVFVSTRPGTADEPNGGKGRGVLWALDGKTGKRLWHFDTVSKDLWGDPRVNSGGGLWHSPAFDGEGSMYFSVGSPAPFPGTKGAPWGASRPGPNLYTNSIIKMDTRTGKMGWHYQLTPHDLYDWDLQGPPILMSVGDRRLVLAAGKSGIVIALDAISGKLVWKHPVGRHNGHDDDGLYAIRGESSKLKDVPTLYPGTLGGVIAPMSTDGSSVFASVMNHPVTVPGSGVEIREYSATNLGELVALDARTGATRWRHEFPRSPMFGATTVVNDLVFTTTYTGKVYAFNTRTGQMAWQSELPAGTTAGVTVSDDTVIAPAGITNGTGIPGAVVYIEGEKAEIVAYRLDG